MSENFEENEVKEKPISNNQHPNEFHFPIIQESKIHNKMDLYPSEVSEIPNHFKIDMTNPASEKALPTYSQNSENLTDFQKNNDKNFHDLIESLKPLGFQANVGLFLIYFYKLKNENQVFEYVTTDRFDKFKHPFLAKEKNDDDSNCLICDRPISSHHSLQEIDRARALAIYNSVSHLNPQDLKWTDLQDLELITCQICYQYFPQNLIFFHKDVRHDVCLDCLNGYLVTEISNNKVFNMHCPHCMEPFDEELIKKYVNAEIFNKFQRYVENQKVLLNPMLRFCPNCPSGIIKLNNENDPKATCPECKAEVCTKCNRRFHNKTSCQAVMEGELKNWTNKKEVQRCPKCKILVEKVEGCNHMTCFVCRYEFCWLCRGAYTSVHFFPLNPLGCPGLQGMKTKIHKWNCLKILLIRFLCLILCVVLLPFAILLYMPVFFFAFVFDSRFYRRNIRDNGFCLKITFITFLVLLCIVLEPIFIAIEVIGVIPALIFLLVEYISERRRRNRKIVIAQRNIIPVDI